MRAASGGEAGRALAVEGGGVDLAFGGRRLGGLIEDRRRAAVEPEQLGDVEIARTEVAHQHAVHGVEVDVVVAVGLRGADEVLAVWQEDEAAERRLVHEAFVAVGVDGVAHGRGGVGNQHFHLVLSAVKSHYAKAFGCARPEDARHVDVRFGADVHGLDGPLAHVVDVDAHLRIGLAGFGILVAIGARIELAFSALRVRCLVDGELIFVHFALVEADEGQLAAVVRPLEGLVEAEFLFVDPVGQAVDDLVGLAAGRHGALRTVGEFLDIEVVVVDKGHHLPVGRKGGHALRLVAAEGFEGVVARLVDKIFGLERMPVDAPRGRAQQHPLFVGRDLVAVDAVDGGAVSDQVEVDQRVDAAAGGVFVFFDAFVVDNQRIVQSVGRRGQIVGRLRPERVVFADVGNRDVFFGLSLHAQPHCKRQQRRKCFFHHYRMLSLYQKSVLACLFRTCKDSVIGDEKQDFGAFRRGSAFFFFENRHHDVLIFFANRQCQSALGQRHFGAREAGYAAARHKVGAADAQKFALRQLLLDGAQRYFGEHRRAVGHVQLDVVVDRLDI